MLPACTPIRTCSFRSARPDPCCTRWKGQTDLPNLPRADAVPDVGTRPGCLRGHLGRHHRGRAARHPQDRHFPRASSRRLAKNAGTRWHAGYVREYPGAHRVPSGVRGNRGPGPAQGSRDQRRMLPVWGRRSPGALSPVPGPVSLMQPWRLRAGAAPAGSMEHRPGPVPGSSRDVTSGAGALPGIQAGHRQAALADEKPSPYSVVPERCAG
jgi:hypothetical protein